MRYILTYECERPDITTCDTNTLQVIPQSGFLSLPEISAQEAGMLCGAIALLLGTAWIFKQIARALRS
jgi:hypothetical protein